MPGVLFKAHLPVLRVPYFEHAFELDGCMIHILLYLLARHGIGNRDRFCFADLPAVGAVAVADRYLEFSFIYLLYTCHLTPPLRTEIFL